MNFITTTLLIFFITSLPQFSSASNTPFRVNMKLDDLAFEDPSLANLVLKELDVFEPYWGETPYQLRPRQYQSFYISLKPDNQYCDSHRAYWTQNPSYLFTENNYLSSYNPEHFARRFALDMFATNVNPKIHYRSYETDQEYSMTLNTSLIVTGGAMYNARHVGKQFSCLGQSSNHIPGHKTLYQKDHAALNLREYAKRYESRPQCFRKFFPKSFVMAEKQHCQEFLQVINSQEYQQEREEKIIVFIRKVVGLHAGSGVTPVDFKEEKEIRRFYQNGEACGKQNERALIQHFVPNPLLIDGKKSDFRLYLLIASTNPLIAFYHDGYFRISFTQYDAHSQEKSSLVTNSAISPELAEAKKTGFHNGKTYAELKEDQSWLFDKFQENILKEGLVTDPNWVDNYLRPECKKAMVHLLRMSQHNFLKRSSLFELYGVDFMLDDQLNLWFIEANALPGLLEKSPLLTKFEGKMLRDEFDIIFRLLRSRMKRVFHYVNTLIVRGEATRVGEDKVEIQDFEAHIKEFRQISQNRFEPEFEPLANNGFVKIIDENYSGTKMYSDLLSHECL